MSARGVAALALALFVVSIPALASEEAPVLSMDALVYEAPAGAVERAATMSDLVMASPRILDEHRHHIGALSMVEQAKLYSDPDGSGEKGVMIVGLQRALPQDIRLMDVPSDLEANTFRTHRGGLLEKSLDGSLSWTTAISSEGAGAIRLKVRAAGFPVGSKAYVYSLKGEVHGPYNLANVAAEGLWSNTVFAEEVYFEVQLGKGDARGAQLTISEISHIEHPYFAPRAGTTRPVESTEDSCFMDASCVTASEWSNAANATLAIGAYIFSKSGAEYYCTGGLLNDTISSRTPYFLTANHCFTSQPSATSMEVFWRFKSTTCNGVGDPSNSPRTSGATLLATSATSDFTFVRLNGNPPNGSVFLGWDASTNYSTTPGVKTYRMHHFNGEKMRYARHETTTVTGSPCGISTAGHFFSWDKLGGTGGGSSGSPVMLADLKVIGQLRGGCGPDVSNNCDRRNYNVDGAFKATFATVQQYLAPGGGGTNPCVSGTNKLCLLSNRFEVTLTARDPRTNNTGTGQAVSIVNNPGTGFGYFSIPALTGDAVNAEILVKMLDATSFTNYYWVFYGALTDFDVTITIRDTTTGRVKTYQKAPLGLAGGSDTAAFPKN